MNQKGKNKILKRVLRSSRGKDSSSTASAQSHTGAVPEVDPVVVEAMVPTIEEEPANKRLRIEEKTVVEVFRTTVAASKLFKDKGVISPRPSKEATDLIELLFIPGDDSTRHPHPQMGRFHISSNQSQSLDAAGGERLVDTLMDCLGAEKALGAGVSTSAGGSKKEQGIEKQIEAHVAAQKEEEACSPYISMRTEDPTGVEKSPERVVVEVEEIAHVPLLMITAAGEAEEPVQSSNGADEQTVVGVSEPYLAGGEDLPRSVEEEGITIAPVDTSHGILPPESPPRNQAMMANIEYVVEKILMKKLSNNWSLEAYRKKVDDAVVRSKDNKEAIERFAQSMETLEKTIATMQGSITDLWEYCAGQDIISERVRGHLTVLSAGQELVLEQVSDLQNLTCKITEDVSTTEADLKKIILAHSSFLGKNDIVHGAINARLGSLEKLRRYDNLNRGLEKTAEYNSSFMAGFQKCCEVLIANGAFPRRMLHNLSFMNLVKDKDGLLQRLVEKDSQPLSRAEGSQEQPE